MSARVILVDNYDSFTFNLVHALELAGAAVTVVPNDGPSADELLGLAPDGFVISAGPCEPERSGTSLALCRLLLAAAPRQRPPLFGVCLGHQAIAAAAGGHVVRARAPVHGKLVEVVHDGARLFAGAPNPLAVARYNSLVVARASLPDCLEVSATTDGEIMALRHRTLPIEGVQFHPESVLCPGATTLFARFVAWVAAARAAA